MGRVSCWREGVLEPEEAKNFSSSELELNPVKGEGRAGLSRLWVMGRLLRTDRGWNSLQEHPRFVPHLNVSLLLMQHPPGIL